MLLILFGGYALKIIDSVISLVAIQMVNLWLPIFPDESISDYAMRIDIFPTLTIKQANIKVTETIYTLL